MVQKGTSLPIVQAVLGHSSVQVTRKYAHFAPDVMMSAMQDVFGKCQDFRRLKKTDSKKERYGYPSGGICLLI
jgi:hypothetical protein